MLILTSLQDLQQHLSSVPQFLHKEKIIYYCLAIKYSLFEYVAPQVSFALIKETPSLWFKHNSKSTSLVNDTGPVADFVYDPKHIHGGM